jgi:hypothetical protein
MPQTFITDLPYCTHCKEKIDDLKILIKFQYKVFRKTASDTWEIVDNTNVDSNEMLCKNCFDKFVEALDQSMNSGAV